MIIRKIITVIFFVIIGITIVTCAVSTNKRRSGLKKEGIGKKIGHKYVNSDASLPILWNYGVMRRSLNSVFNKFSDNQILYKDSKGNIIEKLKLSVIFRDNILYIFSYLLHGCDNGLTEEQYTSLQMLYDVIRKKMVPVYNILPALSELDTTDKNQQTITILLSLAKNLPPYLRCTANFLAQEIEQNKFDLNILFTPMNAETFHYLSNINSSIFRNQSKFNEEMKANDNQSHITQNALGSVFVGLLHNLHVNKLPLSQELFGLILINLPNPSDDPVLEENVKYLYDVTINNYIVNWNSIEKDVVSKDAYSVIFSTLSKIFANPSTAIVVRSAAVYVYNHLKLVGPTHANSNFNYIYNLIKQDINMGMLLSAIIPEEFGPDAVRMKDQLLMYFMHNYKNKDLNQALRGFNRFAYRDPLDFLMAFLTRIQNRIPTSNANILQPVTALLSTLIMKKYTQTFMPFVSPEVDVLILLESMKSPDVDPMLSSMIDSIKLELISQPQLSVLLSTVMPVEKDKCLLPRQCLVNTFQQVERLQGKLPLTLIKKIQNVAHTLQSSPIQYESQQSFATQYSMIPASAQATDARQENAVVVVLEPDNVQTLNVPELGGSSYVWNIDIGETDHAVLDGSMGVSESAPPADIDSAETKVVTSITTERAQTIEHLPRETSSSKSTILIDNFSPQVSYKPMQKIPIVNIKSTSSPPTQKVPIVNIRSTFSPPMQSKKPEILQTEQPYHATYTESSSEESSFKIEYTETPAPVSQIPISMLEKKKDVTHNIHSTITVSSVDRPRPTIKPEPSPTIEEKTQPAENVSNAILFPPSIELDQPLQIQMSSNGVPVVTTDDSHDTSAPKLVLPGIKELLKPPNVNDLFEGSDTPIVTQVLQPLSAIFGSNYIKKIVKEVDTKPYSTNIALLSAILKKAKNYPQVAKNTDLINLIRKYIVSIDFISPTILLPIITSVKKLTSNVVYSTFNQQDLTHNEISENPPDDSSSDTVTVPLVNPKTLLQPINPSKPYTDLLPVLEEGDIFEVKLQPLRAIFTSEKITEILGPNFQPLVYPNKGALLIALLRKLRKTKIVQSNPELKSLIEIYLQAIEIPSMNVHVSEDNLVKMKSETTGHWQPELTSLIYALPTARNKAETAMMKQIERLLSDMNLLAKLQIAKPPSTMSRGELLQKIIRNALSGKINLEVPIVKALRYYKNKVQLNGMGALPIMWVWVEVYVVNAEINLGSMIQNTLDFNKLKFKDKIAYNDLVTYLSANPDLLQHNEDFNFENHKTQGQFIKALLKYLSKKSELDSKIRKNIQKLLPHVSLSGLGAVPLPSFFEF